MLVLFCGGIYAVAAWGWGRLVAKRVDLADLPAPWMVAFGITVVIAIGGLLNFLGIARPMMLNGLVAIGLGLTALDVRRVSSWRTAFVVARSRWRELIWIAPSIAVVAFMAWHLAPPAIFNYHDDFEKYLVHPKRMIEAGSVAGSLFGAVGTETLGAMAYLQGFVAANTALPMVATVDAVFAFGLVLAMVGSACARWRTPPAVTLLVLTAVAALNPQAANLTATYVAIVLILLLLATPLLLDGERPIFLPWMGIVAASFLALKTSFAIVLALQFIMLASCLLLARRKRQEFVSAGTTVLVFIGAIVPWLAATLPWKYLGRPGDPPLNSALLPPSAEESFEPWATVEVIYGFGETWLHYSVLMLLVLGLAGLRVYGTRCLNRRAAISAGAGAAPIVTGVTLVYFSVSGLGFDATLRYMAGPLLASVIVCMLAWLTPDDGANATRRWPNAPRWIAACFATTIIAGAYSSAENRFRQIATSRGHYAVEAFFSLPWYRTYIARTLSIESQERLSRAQASVPAGSKMLASTPLGFQFDYGRNVVVDVNPWFLLVPWLARPASHDVAGWRAYLAGLGVDYLLIQYQGFGIWTPSDLEEQIRSNYFQDRLFGVRMTGFKQTLAGLAREGGRIYDDGQFLIVRLRKP
jgi:hypothetical protein